MSDLEPITPEKAEEILLRSNFKLIKSVDDHKVYLRDERVVILPFYKDRMISPRMIEEIYKILGAPD